jgi:hypothetical protein
MIERKRLGKGRGKVYSGFKDIDVKLLEQEVLKE